MSARGLRIILGVLVAAAAGCERRKSVSLGESARGTPPHAASAPSTPSIVWHRDVGPAILVAGESPRRATVVFIDRDSASAALDLARRVPATLIGKDGAAGSTPVTPPPDTVSCGTWQVTEPPPAWTVGFLTASVRPLAIDSLASFARADSQHSVVAVRRLASALPDDAESRFTGLPFTVRALWRVRLASRVVVVAALIRQINQEASPLQERTFLIAETSGAEGDSSLNAVYSERSHGLEETIETIDLLAAAQLGPSQAPTLVVARDYGDGVAYSLLQRRSDSAWQLMWTSARSRC